LILLKRILLIVLFIASTVQAIAAVAMPYQMMKTNHVPVTTNDSMQPSNSECEMCPQHGMSEAVDSVPCMNECEGCPAACSLNFINSFNFSATVFPAEKPVLNEENHISSTIDNLFRPPIFC